VYSSSSCESDACIPELLALEAESLQVPLGCKLISDLILGTSFGEKLLLLPLTVRLYYLLKLVFVEANSALEGYFDVSSKSLLEPLNPFDWLARRSSTVKTFADEERTTHGESFPISQRELSKVTVIGANDQSATFTANLDIED